MVVASSGHYRTNAKCFKRWRWWWSPAADIIAPMQNASNLGVEAVVFQHNKCMFALTNACKFISKSNWNSIFVLFPDLRKPVLWTIMHNTGRFLFPIVKLLIDRSSIPLENLFCGQLCNIVKALCLEKTFFISNSKTINWQKLYPSASMRRFVG